MHPITCTPARTSAVISRTSAVISSMTVRAVAAAGRRIRVLLGDGETGMHDRQREAPGLDAEIGRQGVHLGDAQPHLGLGLRRQYLTESIVGEVAGFLTAPGSMEQHGCFGDERRTARIRRGRQRESFARELT